MLRGASYIKLNLSAVYVGYSDRHSLGTKGSDGQEGVGQYQCGAPPPLPQPRA